MIEEMLALASGLLFAWVVWAVSQDADDDDDFGGGMMIPATAPNN